MGWFRSVLRAVTLALVATAALGTTNTKTKGKYGGLTNACDDGMGGDDGSDLAKIRFTSVPLPPSPHEWVHPHVQHFLNDEDAQARLDDIMSWPRDAPRKTGCKLLSYAYTKLCVPSSGKKNKFRTKLALQTTCGDMNVKWRVAVKNKKPVVATWGRSKT